MNNENLLNLIWGIVKAVAVFIFRLLLLIPMVIIALIGAAIGASEASITDAIWTCISHPFKALAEAIRSISYEIKTYRNNK